jgi:hypothetical protein
MNDSIVSIDFEDQNPLLEAYDTAFASTIPNLLRDVFLSVVGITAYAVFLYKILRNIKSINICSSLSKILIKGSKKLCCCNAVGKKKLEPTSSTLSTFNPAITHQSTNSCTPFSVSAFAQHIPPSAPPAIPCAPSYREGGPENYHTIGNKYNSSTSLYQARMPTRSCSNINIKEEPCYEGVRGEFDTMCPHCPMYPPPKWPKYCKGTVGLVLHMAKTHNIK